MPKIYSPNLYRQYVCPIYNLARCKCVCPNPSVVNATHTERKLYIKNVPPRYCSIIIIIVIIVIVVIVADHHHHGSLDQPLQLSKRGDCGGRTLRDRHRCLLPKMCLQVEPDWPKKMMESSSPHF